jgi:hypothetical protein
MKSLLRRIRGVVRPTSCPVPATCPSSARRRKVLRLSLPLLWFVVPTVVIAYGVVIPKSCIAGLNELTVGFATTVLGACLTYFAGVRAALKG